MPKNGHFFLSFEKTTASGRGKAARARRLHAAPGKAVRGRRLHAAPSGMPQKKKSIHLPPLGTESTRSRDRIGTLQLLDDLNVNTIFAGLTQSIILHQPKNVLRFMYDELGRMIEEEDVSASSSQFDRAAIDSCLLRMRCEYEGPDGSRKSSFTRLVPLAETMQRYRAEQQAVQDMHSVFWGRAEEQPSSPEAAVASMAQLAEATSKGDGKNQAVLGLGEAQVRSDAATLVQQMQTQQLEAEVQRLTTALAEANSQVTQVTAGAPVYICIHTYIHTYICTCMCVYIYRYIYI